MMAERFRAADSLATVGAECYRLGQQVKRLRQELRRSNERVSDVRALETTLVNAINQTTDLERALRVKNDALTVSEARRAKAEELVREKEAIIADLNKSVEEAGERAKVAESTVEEQRVLVDQARRDLEKQKESEAVLRRGYEEVVNERSAAIASAREEAVRSYKASKSFAVDAADYSTQSMLSSLGQVVDQILALYPDFPIANVPLLQVADGLRKAGPSEPGAEAGHGVAGDRNKRHSV